MADELNVRGKIKYNATAVNQEDIAPPEIALSLDIAGDDHYNMSGIQAVGTSVEALDQGQVGTIGWVLIKNLDATNFVTLNADNDEDNPTIKILPGEFALFRCGFTALYITADTAGVDVQYWLWEA